MTDDTTKVNIQVASAKKADRSTQKTSAPTSVGKYQIVGVLGQGACGVVYRGHDPFVQRDVAIKISRADAAGDQSGALDRESEFFVEARAAGLLQHPNIVSVFDAGSENGMNYIVMEFVSGQTLGELNKPDPERVVEIAFDSAKALDYAHRQGVLHRDIKPDNIMLRDDGVTKVMDFSIAAVMQGSSVRPDTILGTPSYMAPEQIAGVTMGPPTDLYSLGAVMYSLLTGRPPHVAESQRQLLHLVQNSRAAPLGAVRPDLPERLCEIVDKLLSMDPAKRYATGGELARDLLQVYDRRRVALQRETGTAERRAVAAMPFCQHMTAQEIDEFVAAGQIERFNTEQLLLRAGTADSSLHLVIVGTLETRTQRAQLVGPGSVFGGLGLPGDCIAAIDVVALSEGLMLTVPRESLQACSVSCQLRVQQACCQTLIAMAADAAVA